MAKAAKWNPRRLREHLGFDVRAWAMALGVSDRTIDRWEHEGVAPARQAAEVLGGVAGGLDAGVRPATIRDQIARGLSSFLFTKLTGDAR
jgi:hypothetical protein